MAWHIHTIDRMFAGPDTQASIIIGGREVWVRAVPAPYYTFPVERIKAAWAVLTGKAHAVKWPREGDLERVWHGGGRAPRPRRYAVKEKD